jgi:hypothetical protein
VLQRQRQKAEATVFRVRVLRRHRPAVSPWAAEEILLGVVPEKASQEKKPAAAAASEGFADCGVL